MPGQKCFDPFTGNNIVSGKARQVKEDKGRYLAGVFAGFQLRKSRAHLIMGTESAVGINADVCHAVFLRIFGQSRFLPGNRRFHIIFSVVNAGKIDVICSNCLFIIASSPAVTVSCLVTPIYIKYQEERQIIKEIRRFSAWFPCQVNACFFGNSDRS